MSTSNVTKFLSDYFNFHKNVFKHLRYMEISTKGIQTLRYTTKYTI